MAKALGIINIHRAEVGAHGHGFFLHHQDGGGGVFRQPRAPAQQQVFEAALQRGVEGGADQRRAVRTVEAAGQQRRKAGFEPRGEQQRLLQGFINGRLRPHLEFGKAVQHFVAGLLGTLRVAIRAQTARRLGQYGEQRGFGMGQLRRGLAQIRPTGRRHALQRPAKGRAVQVQIKDLVLGQMPFQLRSAPQLTQLAVESARMRVEQPRHLHRQGAAARHHARAGQVLPRRPQQRQRVHAGVLVKPAIFVGEQRVQVVRRHLTGLHRIPPHAIGVGKAPQRRAILGQHHARQIILGQRQRPHTIRQPQQRNHQQHQTHAHAQ